MAHDVTHIVIQVVLTVLSNIYIYIYTDKSVNTLNNADEINFKIIFDTTAHRAIAKAENDTLIELGALGATISTMHKYTKKEIKKENYQTRKLLETRKIIIQRQKIFFMEW